MALPPDELVVSEQYWRAFGQPPDKPLMELCGELLRQGADVDLVARAVRNLPLARHRAESLRTAERFSAHGQVLPFRVTEVPGATTLVVVVPGILIDEDPPAESLPPGVEAPVHLLSIGMSPLVPRAAQEWRAWADAAAELVAREAARLGVERSRVVCFGASIQGARALMVGCRAKVGTVVIGAPDVRLGTWFDTLRTWTAKNVCTHPAFVRLYDWCRIADGAPAIDSLDRLVPDSCLDAPDTRIVGIVSPGDLFYADVLAFAAELQAAPGAAQVSLEELDYGEHDNVFPPFWARLNDELQRLTGHQP